MALIQYKIWKKKGFTLIELLVVIAIIGLLSSIVLASLNSARAKTMDVKRLASLKQVQLALELYFDQYGFYPGPSGIWQNDCNPPLGGQGNWETTLASLQPFISVLPHEPRYPNNPDPWCFFYAKDIVLDCGGLSPRPYILVFSVEQNTYSLPIHNNFMGALARYCLMP